MTRCNMQENDMATTANNWVHVQRLRSKIEHDPENPSIVVTVRGVGYRAGGAS